MSTTPCRRATPIAVAAIALLGTLSLCGGARADDPAGEAPPDAPRQSRAVRAAGETRFYVDAAGNGVFILESGYDLDQYLYRSHGPLKFTMTIPSDFGPVDEDGHPIEGNSLFDRVGRLTLRVFDVDDDYPGTDVEREIDLVSINGFLLPPELSGATDQWSINTLQLPLIHLRLPTPDNPDGRNEIEIDIDTANSGDDVWAVQVDWAELRLSAEELPLAMIHGFGGSDNDFAAMEEWVSEEYTPLDGRIARPVLTRRDSIRANVELMISPIQDLLRDSGSYSLNILAHSMGGLDSRFYAWDHPSRVQRLVMMGTPNGGTRIADIVCGLESPWNCLFSPVLCALRPILRDQFGECDGPEDGLYQLTQSYVQDVFNKQVLDRRGTEYSTIAGRGFDFRNILIDGEDDGLVSVASVEYLDQLHPDHPGLHNARGIFEVNHNELLAADSDTAEEALCTLYSRACESLGSAARGAAAPASFASLDALMSEGAVSTAERVEVPPSGTADVVLDFEGAATAVVYAIAEGGPDGLGARFMTTELTRFEGLGVAGLGAVLTSLTPGTLRLSNATSFAKNVAVLVALDVPERLSVVATPAFVRVGEPVTIESKLAGASGGEVPRVGIVQDGAVVTEVALVPLGADVWTGTFVPASRGTFSVSAVSTGARPLVALDLVTVGSGGATIDGPFTEASTDDDGDGLLDALLITVQVSVAEGGAYRLAAQLVAEDGTILTGAGATADLAAGTQVLSLAFDGREIFAAGRSGSYRIANVALARDDAAMTIEDEVAQLGVTSVYDFRSFEHARIEIDADGFSDEAIDVDADGFYDELVITGRVRADVGAVHEVNARLSAPGEAEIAEFQATIAYVAGWNVLRLTFPWGPIATAGLDGPYLLEDLSIYPSASSDQLAYLILAHRTAPYPASGRVVPARDDFLCHATVATRGDLCSADAPLNPGGPCETEEDCGGIPEDEASLCAPSRFPKGLWNALSNPLHPDPRAFEIKKPIGLCTPADVNREGIDDPETRLRGYRIVPAKKRCDVASPMNGGATCRAERDCGGTKGTTSHCSAQPKPAARRGLAITNSLHPAESPLLLDAIKPDALLISTRVDRTAPPPAPGPHDAYTCYKANLPQGSARFVPIVGVQIDDALTAASAAFDVRRPSRLCAPTDRNGEGTMDDRAYLVCYAAQRSKRVCAPAAPLNPNGACVREEDCGGVRGATRFCSPQAKFEPVRGVFTTGALGRERLDATKEGELCLSSEVTLPD